MLLCLEVCPQVEILGTLVKLLTVQVIRMFC